AIARGCPESFMLASNARNRTAKALRMRPDQIAFLPGAPGRAAAPCAGFVSEWIGWVSVFVSVFVMLVTFHRYRLACRTKIIGRYEKLQAGSCGGKPKRGKSVSVSRKEFKATIRSPDNSRTMSDHGLNPPSGLGRYCAKAGEPQA